MSLGDVADAAAADVGHRRRAVARHASRSIDGRALADAHVGDVAEAD